ncbi:MAG: cytochrome P450 [Nostoc sp. DedSLP03]|nr:cytochrome P450 [Nostoc sp. DedSLP03]
MPGVLQWLQWLVRPLEFLDACHQKYGDIFTIRFNNTPVVLFSNPQAIQEVLNADPNLFEVGKDLAVLRPQVGNESLLLLNGSRHRRHRQLLMPPFHGERMRVYGQVICNITEEVIQQWKIGQPFEVRSFMQDISLQVMLRTVFGLKEGPRFQKLASLWTAVLELSSGNPLNTSLLFLPGLQKDLGNWSPWGRFLRQKEQIDKIIYSEISQRREQFDPTLTDILSLLMSAIDEAGQHITDVELHDELLTLLLAGNETTAGAMTWALYWIYRTPEVRDKLLHELDTLGPSPDPSAIAKLPYLNAVCQETLRISPVVIIVAPRILKSPFKLMGYEFDADTGLAPCIYLTHRQQDIYPEPDRFKPERFLERQFSPYEYLPFGGSNRRCIGFAFAPFQMKLVLATVLSRLQLEVVDQHPIKSERRGVIISPPRGLKMIVTDKHSVAKTI